MLPQRREDQFFASACNGGVVALVDTWHDVILFTDRRSSTEDLLASINASYQAGKFKRFGLSNYLAMKR
jgi:hypothetical protein